ncbi:MAG: hypothetical protein HY815_20230 [Candidatus Riflebacteria bacterium]|nr:hypothetical protein [Candidatus Riflebacteria bacterium]
MVVAHRLGPDPRQLPGADALTAAGLTYMALGHNGSPLSSRDRSGSIRLGLGGDPVLAEVPAKRGGLLVGELREDGSVEVDLVTTAERALHSVGCEVSTLCRPELLPGRVALLLREAGVRPRDLVVVTLEGSWPHATPPRIAPRAFEGQCYHLEVRPGRMWVPTLARRTVREAHLAALAPRPLDGHETARAAGLDLALAAWEGLEVIPPGENPADPA